MVSNEAGHSPSAPSRVRKYDGLRETHHRPSCGDGAGVELEVGANSIWAGMPVVAVGLNNESGILEDEIGLPSVEHGLMHLEMEPTLLEFGEKGQFNRGHLGRKNLSQSSLTDFLTGFGACHLAQCILAAPLSHLWRTFLAQIALPDLLACLRRALSPQTILVAQCRLTFLLPIFRIVAEDQHYLPHPFSPFRRMGMPQKIFVPKFGLSYVLPIFGGAGFLLTSKKCLAQLLFRFGGVVASLFHMFNYNTLSRSATRVC